MKEVSPNSENSTEPQLPSSYMRARRPHLFSDSVKRTDISLSKEVLSHHLETLTKQKSETVFEGFAKRLVEKFVAPNLRFQTGPTGGGDGKTDAETYPVAKEISERWFAADQAAANERWAFAFSAKEDWRGKVRSDVKEITGTTRGYARSRTEKQAEFAEERRIEQGHRIGALVIGTSFDDLKRLGKFPAALDRLGLLQVSTTLLFLMGGEQALRDEAAVPAEETTESIEGLFDRLAAARKSAQLPSPDYLLDEKVLLRSRVLGCEVTAVCENNLTSIGIAEAILGALESLLATSLNLRMFPHLDRLKIRVQSKEGADITPVLEFVEESGSTVAVVTHRPKLRYATREETLGFPRWLQEAVVRLFVTFAEPDDFESWGDTVLGEENGFSRAITFSNTPIAYSEIFGDTVRLDVDRWVEDGDPQIEVKRSSAWSEPASEITLEKFDIVVRPAWTISENDPDSVALNPDDPPVVPMGQANPPVLKALEKKAKLRESRKK